MYIFIAKTNVGHPVSRGLLGNDLKDSTQHCSFAGTHRHGPHMAVGIQDLAGAIWPQSSVDWTQAVACKLFGTSGVEVPCTIYQVTPQQARTP